MEIASNKGVIADASTPAGRAGMSESEWREAIKFDSTDTGWEIMSIGMAIGAGIVFLPVQVGLMGLWVFLLSSVIGYPAMYLFQRLFINTLAESPECKDYPGVISGYLGKNWGILLGALYFVMLVIWMFVYSTANKLCGNRQRGNILLIGFYRFVMSHRQRERHGVEKDGDKQNAKRDIHCPQCFMPRHFN